MKVCTAQAVTSATAAHSKTSREKEDHRTKENKPEGFDKGVRTDPPGPVGSTGETKVAYLIPKVTIQGSVDGG